jgi:hypothetical protein
MDVIEWRGEDEMSPKQSILIVVVVVVVREAV